MGLKEVGLLDVRKERITQVLPHVVARGWGNQVHPHVKGTRKFESLEERDDAVLAAIATAIDFHRAISSARVEARMIELASILKTDLADAGRDLVTPIDSPQGARVCVIRAPSRKWDELCN